MALPIGLRSQMVENKDRPRVRGHSPMPVGWTRCPYPDNLNRTIRVMCTRGAPANIARNQSDCPERPTHVQSPDNRTGSVNFLLPRETRFAALPVIAPGTRVGAEIACTHPAGDAEQACYAERRSLLKREIPNFCMRK